MLCIFYSNAILPSLGSIQSWCNYWAKAIHSHLSTTACRPVFIYRVNWSNVGWVELFMLQNGSKRIWTRSVLHYYTQVCLFLLHPLLCSLWPHPTGVNWQFLLAKPTGERHWPGETVVSVAHLSDTRRKDRPQHHRVGYPRFTKVWDRLPGSTRWPLAQVSPPW